MLYGLYDIYWDLACFNCLYYSTVLRDFLLLYIPSSLAHNLPVQVSRSIIMDRSRHRTLCVAVTRCILLQISCDGVFCVEKKLVDLCRAHLVISLEISLPCIFLYLLLYLDQPLLLSNMCDCYIFSRLLQLFYQELLDIFLLFNFATSQYDSIDNGKYLILLYNTCEAPTISTSWPEHLSCK